MQPPPHTVNVSQAEWRRLSHELHLHQVELELQNKELRRSQEELLAARDRYAELYDFAPVGYLTLDDSGRILEANLTVATMLGVVRSKLLGMRFTHFLSREDQDAFYLHRHHVKERRTRDACDIEIQRADGTVFWARLETLAAGHTAGNRLDRYHTSLSDITAFKQDEEARLQAAPLISLGTFAAGLAHALHNPLYAISSTAEHAHEVLSKTHAQTEIDDCLVDILADVGRCTRLVKNVLNFARQGSREQVTLDLHPLIQSIYDLTQRYAQQYGVRQYLRLAHTQPRIVGNRADLELALVNLIHNAIEASSDGSYIEVETVVETTHVLIRVHDRGHGLTEEALQRVFDPFYTTRQAVGGTGLGLSLSRRVIMDHCGTVELQSHLGQGTTARIRLPLAPPGP